MSRPWVAGSADRIAAATVGRLAGNPELAGAHAGIVLGRRPDRVSWIAMAVGDRRGRLHRGYSSAASV